MPYNHIKNIGFVSTRIAGIDGVSLEIEKWANVLQRNHYNCFYFAGQLDRDDAVSFKIDLAHFKHPEIAHLNGILFGVVRRSPETSDKIEKITSKLKSALYDFKQEFDIDLLLPENALAIPMNVPMGLALAEFIAETALPTIAHHHDFSWERDRFTINACQDYLNMAFPPDLPSMRHVVINSLASVQLSHRLGISNTIIPNVYDFANVPTDLDDYPCELRGKIGLKDNEVLILQPTRIVPRKWIERSIEIVRDLNLPDPKLVISHASGDEGDDYYQRVLEYAENTGVKIISIGHLIQNNYTSEEGKYKVADIYKCADLVTYPSGYEGFGNAFLEAVYFQKPIIVNRYSVYIADIEPKGFDVIAFDGFVTRKVIDKIVQVLNDKNYCKRMTEKNYEVANRFFSYEVLENKLLDLIHSFES